mmetsp:Transcript_27660/g.95672  ORF Transcript_27660/g.95672 Transcript_27660/m.95672 type:complete len:235 (-) Transcript_27660:6-710(-)
MVSVHASRYLLLLAASGRGTIASHCPAPPSRKKCRFVVFVWFGVPLILYRLQPRSPSGGLNWFCLYMVAAWQGWCESPTKWMRKRSARALSSCAASLLPRMERICWMAQPTLDSLCTESSAEYIGSRTKGRLMKCHASLLWSPRLLRSSAQQADVMYSGESGYSGASAAMSGPTCFMAAAEMLRCATMAVSMCPWHHHPSAGAAEAAAMSRRRARLRRAIARRGERREAAGAGD